MRVCACERACACARERVCVCASVLRVPGTIYAFGRVSRACIPQRETPNGDSGEYSTYSAKMQLIPAGLQSPVSKVCIFFSAGLRLLESEVWSLLLRVWGPGVKNMHLISAGARSLAKVCFLFLQFCGSWSQKCGPYFCGFEAPGVENV